MNVLSVSHDAVTSPTHCGREDMGGGRHCRGALNPVQRVYDAVRDMIARPDEVDGKQEFAEAYVNKVVEALAGVTLGDLGVEDPSAAAKKQVQRDAESSATRIMYRHVHEDDGVSIGVFELPRGAVIPLHNHPSMTVFSRVLYGTLHIRAYDWASASYYDQPCVPGVVRPAYLTMDGHISAPVTSVLFPTRNGNIHAFRAITDCAVLDVLAPPYRGGDRGCTYYVERAFRASEHPSFPQTTSETANFAPAATTPVRTRAESQPPGMREWDSPAEGPLVEDSGKEREEQVAHSAVALLRGHANGRSGSLSVPTSQHDAIDTDGERGAWFGSLSPQPARETRLSHCRRCCGCRPCRERGAFGVERG